MMDLQNVDQLVQVQRSPQGVVRITLNDPQRFNALGAEMLVALQQALDAVAADASARVVVLAAQGKAFCAGHNLKDMAATPNWPITSSCLPSAAR
jgi:enoyl-CoA hydratase/carnithine racemase